MREASFPNVKGVAGSSSEDRIWDKEFLSFACSHCKAETVLAVDRVKEELQCCRLRERNFVDMYLTPKVFLLNVFCQTADVLFELEQCCCCT